jgi:hypothetical protein
MESQPVICPNCSAQVRGEHINIQEMVGKCARCDHIFRLTLDRPVLPRETLGTEPSRPSGVTIEQGMNDELLLIRRWFHPALFFLLFFCIAWDGFLVFWYSMALFGGVNGNDGFQWLAIVFPICHVAVGVGLTYFVIAGFLNKTTVFLDDEILAVRHGPVPWFGNRNLQANRILGIELDYVHSNNNNPNYAISAHAEDGRQIVLLSGLQTKQAEYIAWQLANKLGVPLSNNA